MKKTQKSWNSTLKASSKPLKRSPLKKVSKKMSGKLKEYSKLRKEYLMEHPFCEATGAPAVDIHHKRGRGPYLNDTSTWMAVSREIHDWIHSHPNEAREKGWLI